MATQARKSATKKTTKKAATKKAAPVKAAGKSSAVMKSAPAAKEVKKSVGKATVKISEPIGSKIAKTSTPGKPMASKSTSLPPGSQPGKKLPETSTVAKSVKPLKPAAAAPKSRARRPGPITPEQALANTRALLEAKHERDRGSPPWQALETQPPGTPHAGYQSDEARDKAEELHAGESRMPAIHGSIGSQDRQQQGKRDGR